MKRSNEMQGSAQKSNPQDKWPTEFEKGGPFEKIWGPRELPIYDANCLQAFFKQVEKTWELLNYS